MCVREGGSKKNKNGINAILGAHKQASEWIYILSCRGLGETNEQPDQRDIER